MRKLFNYFAFAVLSIVLLSSCAKINERIDVLETRIDGIENEKISSINTQIEKINSSIADLSDIRTNIQNLKSETQSQGTEIGNLKNADEEFVEKIKNLESADESIGERIDALKKYVNDTLKAYSTTDWVKATFSTLAQYEATCDTIAKIDARIGDLDARLSKTINDCADSLMSWINKQFSAYYTAAQIDATVAELMVQIDSVSKVSSESADSLAAELSATKIEIDTAKAAIRSEYRSAINEAITESEGKMTNALLNAMFYVNYEINILANKTLALENSVKSLTGRMEKIENMIQTVSFIPAYSDGSIEAEGNTLNIECVVSPANSLKDLTKENVKVLYTTAKTKAASYKEIYADSVNVDVVSGILSVYVTIDDSDVPAAGSTLMAALKIEKGVSKFTTEFIPVSFGIGVSFDQHIKNFVTSDTDQKFTLKATIINYANNGQVVWSSTSHCIEALGSEGKTYEKEVTILANKYGKDTIVVAAKEDLTKTDTCFVNVSPISVEGVSLDIKTLSLYVDSLKTLVATITPNNASNKTITWRSTDESVATVNSNGLTATVKGISEGTAKVIVTTEDGNVSDTCVVSVIPSPEGQGSENGHTWVQLWEDGPKFATENYTNNQAKDGKVKHPSQIDWTGWVVPSQEQMAELVGKLGGETPVVTYDVNGDAVTFTGTGDYANNSVTFQLGDFWTITSPSNNNFYILSLSANGEILTATANTTSNKNTFNFVRLVVAE